MALLFTNQTTNATSSIREHTGGNLQIVVQGTIGSASIQPQIIQDGLSAVDFGDPITGEVAFYIELQPCSVQFVMTGASGTNISLSAT